MCLPRRSPGRAVRDLHSGSPQAFLPTACEAKTATCELCEMTFIPSPAITGSVSATHLGTVVGFQHCYWEQVLVCTFKIRWALMPGSLLRGLCSGGSAHLKVLWQKWVSDQSTSKGSQQGVCPAFALLHEHYPRQCYVQWSENIPTEAGNIPTDFKEIFKQKGNINSLVH